MGVDQFRRRERKPLVERHVGVVVALEHFEETQRGLAGVLDVTVDAIGAPMKSNLRKLPAYCLNLLTLAQIRETQLAFFCSKAKGGSMRSVSGQPDTG
jgi:hypothetical protein